MTRFEITFVASPPLPPLVIEDGRNLGELAADLQRIGHIFSTEVVVLSGRPERSQTIALFREAILKIRETA